jgi:hypothetical protein
VIKLWYIHVLPYSIIYIYIYIYIYMKFPGVQYLCSCVSAAIFPSILESVLSHVVTHASKHAKSSTQHRESEVSKWSVGPWKWEGVSES